MTPRGSRQTSAHLLLRLRSEYRTDASGMVLAALREFGPLTLAELTEGLGYVRPAPVGRALDGLTAEGKVSRHRDASRRRGGHGQRPYVYTLTTPD